MEHWSTQGLRYLKGVGPKVAEKLHKLGLTNQRDLLFHLPLRYEDRTFVSPLGSLQPGSAAQIEAEVLQARCISAVRVARGACWWRSWPTTPAVSPCDFSISMRQQQRCSKKVTGCVAMVKCAWRRVSWK